MSIEEENIELEPNEADYNTFIPTASLLRRNKEFTIEEKQAQFTKQFADYFKEAENKHTAEFFKALTKNQGFLKAVAADKRNALNNKRNIDYVPFETIKRFILFLKYNIFYLSSIISTKTGIDKDELNRFFDKPNIVYIIYILDEAKNIYYSSIIGKATSVLSFQTKVNKFLVSININFPTFYAYIYSYIFPLIQPYKESKYGFLITSLPEPGRVGGNKAKKTYKSKKTYNNNAKKTYNNKAKKTIT